MKLLYSDDALRKKISTDPNDEPTAGDTTMTTMRAKLKVSSVVKHEGGSESLAFSAVYKPEGYEPGGLDEDNTYATYTPYAELKMTVNNPALSGKFKVGDTFYVDFTPVLMWMDGYRAGKRAAKGRRNGHR